MQTKKSNLTIRIEPQLKEEASTLFRSLATGIFYRQAPRCHGLPFEVKLDEPNEITYKAMDDAENGRDMYGPYNSVKELMEALDA